MHGGLAATSARLHCERTRRRSTDRTYKLHFPALTLPFGNATFDQLSWLGVTAPADADGCFYLDSLKLQISE